MRTRYFIIFCLAGCALLLGGLLLAQQPFREYPAMEYGNFPIPQDFARKAEWTRARLRYPDTQGYPEAMLVYGDGSPFPGYWTMDYPRSDRHLLQGVSRLTRIDTRSVEQVVSLDGTDEIYNYPLIYGVEVGHLRLDDAHAKMLREYLERGGFLMVDDFHGTQEWRIFSVAMSHVFPNRPIVDIPNSDAIFHVLYDLNERVQVPGANVWFGGRRTFEQDGFEPHFRGIYDDKGRLMVAVCHNMDLGDAWEHSDNPQYPEKFAGLAYKLAMNYFVYDLTH